MSVDIAHFLLYHWSVIYTITMSDQTVYEISLKDSTVNSGYTIDLTNLGISDNIVYDADVQKNQGIYLPKGDVVLEEGDILLGSASLKKFMTQVSQRLEILQMNPALESQWEELKSLGEAYRKLEAEILEKQRIWNIVKG